jgi:hypothetical protein
VALLTHEALLRRYPGMGTRAARRALPFTG